MDDFQYVKKKWMHNLNALMEDTVQAAARLISEYRGPLLEAENG